MTIKAIFKDGAEVMYSGTKPVEAAFRIKDAKTGQVFHIGWTQKSNRAMGIATAHARKNMGRYFPCSDKYDPEKAHRSGKHQSVIIDTTTDLYAEDQ